MTDKLTRHERRGLLIALTLLFIGGASDDGASIAVVAAGLLVCGVAAWLAYLDWRREKAMERRRERVRRRGA